MPWRYADDRRSMSALRAAFVAKRGLRRVPVDAAALRFDVRRMALCIPGGSPAAGAQIRRPPRARRAAGASACVRDPRARPGAARSNRRDAAIEATTARARLQSRSRDRTVRRDICRHSALPRPSANARRAAAGRSFQTRACGQRPRRVRRGRGRRRTRDRNRRRRDDDRCDDRSGSACLEEGRRDTCRRVGRGTHGALK